MKKPNRQLWITDPWDTLDHPLETTLRLMAAGHALGAEIYWADVASICLVDSTVHLQSQKLLGVAPSLKPETFSWDPPRVTTPDFFQQIHYRVDPPVDLHFLQPIGLLELAAAQYPQIEWVNPLNIIALESEKTAGMWFPENFPNSLVTSSHEQALAFITKNPGSVVKPLHNAGSRGIFRAHTAADLESLVWKRPGDFSGQLYLFQKFLPEIERGETRLWFTDGEMMGSVLKLPKSGDFRILIDEGSRVLPTELTTTQARLADRLGAFLRKKSLRLAAIDIVGDQIVDFNFTSPGLIVQMETVLGKDLATPIQKKLLGL